jgi:hypothetical protein
MHPSKGMDNKQQSMHKDNQANNFNLHPAELSTDEKEKKRLRLSNEMPSIITGCPGLSADTLQTTRQCRQAAIATV